MSAKLKCRQIWNVTKTEDSPKLNCHQNWSVIKTEMLLKLKCYRILYLSSKIKIKIPEMGTEYHGLVSPLWVVLWLIDQTLQPGQMAGTRGEGIFQDTTNERTGHISGYNQWEDRAYFRILPMRGEGIFQDTTIHICIHGWQQVHQGGICEIFLPDTEVITDFKFIGKVESQTKKKKISSCLFYMTFLKNQ